MNNSNLRKLIFEKHEKFILNNTKTSYFPLVLQLNIYLLRVKRIVFLYHIILLTNICITYGQELSLRLVGKDSLETLSLRALNNSTNFNDFNSLETEVELIKAKLERKGYIESELVAFKKIASSSYEAKFHLKNKVDKIYVYTDFEFLSMDIINEVSENVTSDFFLIPIDKLEETISKLNKHQIKQGRSFATFQITNISKLNDKTITGHLKITSTIKRSITNIILKGYEKFPNSYLNRFLGIKIGQELNLDEIKSKCDNLNNLRFANQIRAPEVLFTRDSTSLYLYLEKSLSNTFDGFLGFGTNENSNKLEFNGYLNLNLINNLNYGESLSILYKSDENEQRNFNFNTNLPYILGSPLGLDLNLNIFKKDSTFTITNQSAKIFYQINSKHKISGGIDAINSNDSSSNNASTSILDYKSTFYNLSYGFEHRTNNNLFPLNSSLLVQGALGKRNSDLGNQDQSEVKFRGFKIFTLNQKNSIYLNFDGKLLFSDNFLTNELYRFGGINSIRGFEENSIFASLYTVLNSEYRYVLNNSIYLHSIIDVAYYENKVDELKEKLFGFGFGVGLITKAGLLKLNYSNGIIENQPFKFNNSKIHISLNARF